jgi:hypothetical protein
MLVCNRGRGRRHLREVRKIGMVICNCGRGRKHLTAVMVCNGAMFMDVRASEEGKEPLGQVCSMGRIAWGTSLWRISSACVGGGIRVICGRVICVSCCRSAHILACVGIRLSQCDEPRCAAVTSHTTFDCLPLLPYPHALPRRSCTTTWRLRLYHVCPATITLCVPPRVWSLSLTRI